MRTVVCIIARAQSRRLSNKVLKEIFEKKLIEYIIEKMKHVKNANDIYICTSTEPDDAILGKIARHNGIKFYAGSPTSVIDRMLDVARIENADHIVRVTGDNVFTDEIFLEEMIRLHIENNMDYTRTEKVPGGLTAEVIRVASLKKCYELIDPHQSQYLMWFMFNPDIYKCQVLIPERKLQDGQYNLSVDMSADIERTAQIIKSLYKNGRVFYDDILKLHAEKGIRNFLQAAQGPVKLPNKVIVPYTEFRAEMDKRVQKSKKIILEEGFYASKKPV